MNRPFRFPLFAFATSLVLLGCSSTPPLAQPTASPPEPVVAATAAPTEQASPEVPTVPSAEPDAAPASTLPPPSGRPPVSFEGLEKISETIGGSLQKLELKKDGGAILRIPEYAMRDAVLLTFMLDKKGKKMKSAAGQVFRLYAQTPPSEDFASVSSQGPKFSLRLPTGKLGASNLAMGEVGKDDKGRETLTWKVIAATKTEDGSATFEFSSFTNAYLHLTNEPPTE